MTAIVGQRDWSDLLPEILEIISSKLSSFVHLLSMKGVCSSWRHGIAEIRNQKRHQESLVFLGTCGNSINRTEVDYNVYILRRDEQTNPWRLMKKTLESSCLRSENKQRIVGSHPDGWLVILKDAKHLSLFHLIKETSIPIPIPHEMLCCNLRVDIVSFYNDCKVTLSHSPSRHQEFVMVMKLTFPLHWRTYSEGEIYFMYHGDSTWSPLGIDADGYYIDIAFRNYTLYAITFNQGLSSLQTWDFSSRVPRKIATFELPKVRQPYEMASRLVLPPSGEIFMTIQQWLRVMKWALYKIDMSLKTCVELNSLDGRALLFGEPSLLISSIEVERHGYKPDSIYYLEAGRTIRLKMYSFQDRQVREVWWHHGVDNIYAKHQLLPGNCWMDLSTVVCS